MDYFKWIGAAILIMLAVISGYKLLTQKTVTKNLLYLFVATLLSTLILFGLRPETLRIFGFEIEGFYDSIPYEQIEDNLKQRDLVKTNLAIEINPAIPTNWTTDSSFTFKWYNAPFGLAIELANMNMDNIKNKDVDYQFLMVEGNDYEGREEFTERYERMIEFLQHMKAQGTRLVDNLEVRVLRDERFPSISFYLFNKDGRPVTNIYIDPLIDAAGESYVAFQTYSKNVVDFLDREYEEMWKKAEIIPMDTLQNQMALLVL